MQTLQIFWLSETVYKKLTTLTEIKVTPENVQGTRNNKMWKIRKEPNRAPRTEKYENQNFKLNKSFNRKLDAVK